MAKEAKRCSKMEKKLRVLTGGYQSRVQALIKQFQELNDQHELSFLELSTFKFLDEQEKAAIPRRIEVNLFIVNELIIWTVSYYCILFQSLTEDVARQTEREKQLQKRYAELQTELEIYKKK